MISELAFAFMIGSIATVNPCGFALLPAYLARRLGTDGEATLDVTNALARAFAVGAVTTGGFIVVFGGIGSAVSLGAFWLSAMLPWAGLIIGLALAATGLVVLAGRDVKLGRLTVKPAAAGGGLQGDFLFGVAYGGGWPAPPACPRPPAAAFWPPAATGKEKKVGGGPVVAGVSAEESIAARARAEPYPALAIVIGNLDHPHEFGELNIRLELPAVDPEKLLRSLRGRSEERRVRKECRSRWSSHH